MERLYLFHTVLTSHIWPSWSKRSTVQRTVTRHLLWWRRVLCINPGFSRIRGEGLEPIALWQDLSTYTIGRIFSGLARPLWHPSMNSDGQTLVCPLGCWSFLVSTHCNWTKSSLLYAAVPIVLPAALQGCLGLQIWTAQKPRGEEPHLIVLPCCHCRQH